MGRVASSGEQIGLALAASRDARRWLNDDAAATSESEVVAVRAHAEMLTYWALGAAHGLGNVLLRMLWLDTNARPLLEAAYPKAESFEPFSNSRDAWEQFGPKVIKIARKASGAAASSTGTTIVDALDSLTADPRWDRLMVLRGVNFHQWRPQSLRGGTPKHSMVKENPDGQQMITVGTNPTNAAPDHKIAIADADAGLDALVEAAEVLDSNLYAGINDLTGKPIFGI